MFKIDFLCNDEMPDSECTILWDILLQYGLYETLRKHDNEEAGPEKERNEAAIDFVLHVANAQILICNI